MNKYLIALAAIIGFAFLTGCANTITKNPTTGAVTVDLTKGTLEVATHSDLLGAANVATTAAAKATAANDGVLASALTARALYWTTLDALLTAAEKQASACGNAIAAMKPTLPTLASGPGPHIFTDIEIGAEDIGQFQGITPAAKLACTQIPLIQLPILPKP
jgi:hypothetical protein